MAEIGRSGVVPEQVVESVETTLANLEHVETHLGQFLSLYGDAHLIADLPPLPRAQTLFLLSKATFTLFSLRVRCDVVNPDEHPVNAELVSDHRVFGLLRNVCASWNSLTK